MTYQSEKVNVTDGATLNCDDIPEASRWGTGRAPVARFRGAKVDKSWKPRMKIVGLPAVSETGNGDSDDNYPDWDEPQPEKVAPPLCTCTLLNQALFPCSKACRWHQSKGVATKMHGYDLDANEVPVISSAPSLDWPALPEVWEAAESWVDCDVSSVASSWLEVGGADQQPDSDDDSEFDIILVSDTGVQPRKPSGPLPWAAIVGTNAGASRAPACGVAKLPPMSRQPVVKTRTKSTEEDEDPDVDGYPRHTRRMLGNRIRSRTH